MLLRIDDTDTARNAPAGRRRSSPTSPGWASRGTRGPCVRASGTSVTARRRTSSAAPRRRGRAPLRPHDAPARRRDADLPARDRRRRPRLRDHARHPRLRPPRQRRAAGRADPGARRRPAGVRPPRPPARRGRCASSRSGTAPRPLADLRERGFPAEAVRAYLDELGLPRHDVQLDLARLRRLSTEALAALADEELAARVGVPVSAVPVLRGARDLVEAREYAEARARATPRRARRRAGDASPAHASWPRREPSRGSLVRELKAVGGDLQRAPARAHRPRPRARALGGARGARPGRDSCGGSTSSYARPVTMRLYSTLSRRLEELPRSARARCGCTSAGRPSTSGRTSATRGRSSSACGCARGCASAATR